MDAFTTIRRAVLLIACLAAPTAGWAQTAQPPPDPLLPKAPQTPLPPDAAATPTRTPPPRTGRFWRVSFSTTEVAESNLFATSGQFAQSDLISRATPSAEGSYGSHAVTLIGKYSMDAERYMNHPELNHLVARQEAVTSVAWQPTRRVSVGANAGYLATHSPGELNFDSLLNVRRAPAQRLGGGSSITYDDDERTSTTGSLDYSRDRFFATTTESWRAGLVVERRWDRRTDYRVTYHIQQVRFSGFVPAQPDELFHVITLGWSRKLTRATSLSFDVGPRIGRNTVQPEGSFLYHHTTTTGELTIGYSRSLSTAIGTAGTLQVQEATVGLTRHLLPRLDLAGSSGLARSTQTGREATSWTGRVDATFRVTRRLALVGSGHFGLQSDVQDGGRATVPDRTLSITATFSHPPAPSIPARPRRTP